jgi:FAD-dependent urate hydroxylase
MTKALVIGSGVAGPVAAMALQRAGVETNIYEAHIPIDDDAGSYLTVATNGLSALGAIELPSQGFSTRSTVLLGNSGRVLGQAPIGSKLPDGTTSITIKRARLRGVLLGEARARDIPLTSANALPPPKLC